MRPPIWLCDAVDGAAAEIERAIDHPPALLERTEILRATWRLARAVQHGVLRDVSRGNTEATP